jgi:FkbM family methyltransferase
LGTQSFSGASMIISNSTCGAFLLNYFRRFLKRSNRHTRLSFAQEAEDLVLLELAGWQNDSRGLYVDVGAHHPYRFSNTAIYSLKGWSGINIDAEPGSMELFRRHRPHDVNLELAISSRETERLFYRYNEPALNGIDCDRQSELANTRFRLTDKIRLRTRKLSSILLEYCPQLPRPNFLSVDVEGHDLEVLESNDWDIFPFEWVLAESGGRDVASTLKTKACHFLSSLGYEFRAKTGRTAIFSRTGKP